MGPHDWHEASYLDQGRTSGSLASGMELSVQRNSLSSIVFLFHSRAPPSNFADSLTIGSVI